MKTPLRTLGLIRIIVAAVATTAAVVTLMLATTTEATVSNGVAVDSGHAYWTNSLISGTIGRANLDGTGINQSFITVTDDPGSARGGR